MEIRNVSFDISFLFGKLFFLRIIYMRSDNINYYNEIKNRLIDNEITKKVKDYSKNKSDLETYYNVGKLLFSAGKHYGEGIIKEYSQLLSNDIDRKYNITTLKRMRQFYLMIEKGATVWHQCVPCMVHN